MLGELTSISDGGYHWKIKPFELSPEVLRTCHQIYDEASEILYGLNTFFVLCYGMDNPRISMPRLILLSPSVFPELN